MQADIRRAVWPDAALQRSICGYRCRLPSGNADLQKRPVGYTHQSLRRQSSRGKTCRLLLNSIRDGAEDRHRTAPMEALPESTTNSTGDAKKAPLCSRSIGAVRRAPPDCAKALFRFCRSRPMFVGCVACVVCGRVSEGHVLHHSARKRGRPS